MKDFKKSLFAFFLSIPCWAYGQDIQTLDPKSLKAIRDLKPQEAPETYTVEPGDTLADICDQILNFRDYWPKLWALNPHIKNPHMLTQGTVIRFYGEKKPEDLNNLNKDQNDKKEEILLTDDDFLVKKFEIKDPLYENYKTDFLSFDDIETNKNLFLILNNTYDDAQSIPLHLPGFFLSQTLVPICHISFGSQNEEEISESEDFLCDPENKVKDFFENQYTIVRFKEEFDNDGDSIYRYEFIAHVKLDKVLGDEESYLGHSIYSRTSIQKDDILVSYMSTGRNLEIPKSTEKWTSVLNPANIVAFEIESQSFGGVGDFVYLNRGTKDGFVYGRRYGVYRLMGSTFGEEILQKFPNQMELIGEVWIAESWNDGSLGYIGRVHKEVLPWDVVGF